ncbi:MAG: FkbM family methyltransferase, partial [Gammaproteobacteria bacterium]|nr:FkbM family methyltransferase [Gammaproteobacteria bacterium]
LIETYGAPSFIKLDIEGYEYEALRGLNRPVPVLSFEFVEGMLNNVGRCVTILQQLAPMEFNHSTNEAEGLAQSVWTTGSETLLQLEHAPKSGNVYARIKD